MILIRKEVLLHSQFTDFELVNLLLFLFQEIENLLINDSDGTRGRLIEESINHQECRRFQNNTIGQRLDFLIIFRDQATNVVRATIRKDHVKIASSFNDFHLYQAQSSIIKHKYTFLY